MSLQEPSQIGVSRKTMVQKQRLSVRCQRLLAASVCEDPRKKLLVFVCEEGLHIHAMLNVLFKVGSHGYNKLPWVSYH